MGDIGYGYGSEWHLLRYLGRHQNDLNREIEKESKLQALDARVMDWLDFLFSNHWTLDGEWRKVDFWPRKTRHAWHGRTS